MKTYLKKCPFCGSNKIKIADFKPHVKDYKGSIIFYKPLCTECGISTVASGFEKRDDAIHFWNTRTVRISKKTILKQ
jgi:Lar family restriction alleviation protein